MIDSLSLLPNIVAGYQTDKGLYQIPTRMMIPLLLTNEEAYAATTSFHSMMEYSKKNQNLAFFKNIPFNLVVSEFLKIELPNLITEQNQLDKETFLTLVQDFAYYRTLDHSEPRYMNGLGILQSDPYMYKIGQSAATVAIIPDMDQWFLDDALRQEKEFSLHTMQNVFYGVGCVGINQASTKQETAKAFMRFLLSEAVQKSETYDGLPVEENAWSLLVEREMENRSYGTSYMLEDGTYAELDGEYPKKALRQEFETIAKEVSRGISLSNPIVNVILNEMDGFINSTMEAADTANQVESVLNLYLAEQEGNY